MKTLNCQCLAGWIALVASTFLSCWQEVAAKSPAMIAEGRMLFERNWRSRNPTIGSDGLGPLFNGQSCVACHRQGGVGGAGEAQFNAKSIGIERMQITGGAVSPDTLVRAISSFHPGFIDPQGKVVNTFAMSHHGGTQAFAAARDAFMKKVPVEFSSDGGPVNADEVRRANATPILHTTNLGKYKVVIRARMFQRNTTPLFGSGLIDQVTGKQLENMVKAQKPHPEISGRLATLPDGRYGRFGWRGNVANLLDFCDQACAAEVGLETKRKPQPMDPTNRDYRNPSYDISDQKIKSMAMFVAALPAPTREIPSDSQLRADAIRGEQLFAEIGCAVCHTPNLGPAEGLYSDLLLHDMGPELVDLNPADPHIVRVTPVSRVDREVASTQRTVTQFDDTVSTTYYGNTTSMSGSDSTSRSSTTTRGGGTRSTDRGREGSAFRGILGYDFVVPTQPSQLLRIIPLGKEERQFSYTDVEQENFSRKLNRYQKTESGRRTYNVERTRTTETAVTETREDYLRIHIERTNYSQEWRTPPLWGVRDSAPYMHDGRAETLLEAVVLHEGEGQGTRDRFLQLSLADRNAIITFMNTMVSPRNAPQQPN